MKVQPVPYENDSRGVRSKQLAICFIALRQLNQNAFKAISRLARCVGKKEFNCV